VNAADFWTSLVAQDEARKRKAHPEQVAAIRATGNHRTAQNDEPELSAADRALADSCPAFDVKGER
jgi:hypothetical protein